MNVADFLLGGSAWWVLPCSLLAVGAAFGLMPGLMLRLIVLLYPKDHPRREELFGELYDPEMGRMERFEWVFQQLETGMREGPASRKRKREEEAFDELADFMSYLMTRADEAQSRGKHHPEHETFRRVWAKVNQLRMNGDLDLDSRRVLEHPSLEAAIDAWRHEREHGF